jgi:serine/threonine protein kinase
MNWLPDATLAHLRTVLDMPGLSGRYGLIREIGRGAMGTVYLAEDTQLCRQVALKVVVSSGIAPGDLAERMWREIRILAQLEHPGIVPIHDAGSLPDGRVFYAMKYVQGRRLDQYAEQPHRLPDLLRIFRRICEPVAFAHSHGVVHRDLKPENIMLGSFGEVLVLDWGVAKITEPSDAAAPIAHSGPGTLHGTVIGTPEYMSPEQAAGDTANIDARSDIHALGRILEYLLRHVPERPKPLLAVAARASSRCPQDRYPTVADLASEIDLYFEGEPVQAYRETLGEHTARVLRKHRAIAALVVAYLLMRTVLFFFTRA